MRHLGLRTHLQELLLDQGHVQDTACAPHHHNRDKLHRAQEFANVASQVNPRIMLQARFGVPSSPTIDWPQSSTSSVPNAESRRALTARSRQAAELAGAGLNCLRDKCHVLRPCDLNNELHPVFQLASVAGA